MLVMKILRIVTLLMSVIFSLPLEEKDTNLWTAVTVREMSVEEPGDRSIRSPGMPAKKRFIFKLNGEAVELDLQLNNLIRNDVSVYVTENGVTKLMEIPKRDEEMHGYYQDAKTKAAVMVKCSKLGRKCQLDGTFMFNDKKFRLESTGELSEATHFVTEIHPDESDADIHGDSQQIPELQSWGYKSGNQTKISDTDDKPGRVKQTISTDIIELYIFTDESIYQRFLALYGNMIRALMMLQQYYAIISNEMDLEYQQVKYASTLGIDIRIYLKGLHIGLDTSSAPWSYYAEDSSGNLNSSKALHDFSTWQMKYRIANNLQYDHAMAMTKKKFQGTGVGKTWFSAACFPDSFYHASIIEDRGYRTALGAVVELGHFLSARHEPSTSSCSYGYSMVLFPYTANPTAPGTGIHHTFSSCNIKSMTNFLYRLGTDRCTSQHSFTDAEYTAYRTQPIGGEVLSLDQQCQLSFGSASHACYAGGDMCYIGILCQTSTGCSGTLYQVLDHSSCPGMLHGGCFRGLCVQRLISRPATQEPTASTAHPTTSTVASSTETVPTTIKPAPVTTTIARQKVSQISKSLYAPLE